ncbi:unnamed protein product [Effrenium voratum]|nr:unnamed protein product [Effrenium voratum]
MIWGNPPSFRKSREKRPRAFRLCPDLVLLGALCNARWRQAQLLLSGVQPDIVMRTAAISACEKSTQWRQALRLSPLPKITAASSAAASAAGAAKAWAHALQLALGAPLDIAFHDALLSASEKAGQWQQALHLFARLPVSRASPGLISCNALVSACGARERWEFALQAFARLSRPSVVSYGAALSAFEEAGQWQQAVWLLTDAIRITVQVNVICFNAVISACEQGVQWLRAAQLLLLLTNLQLEGDVVTHTAVIGACALASRWSLALAHFEEMQRWSRPNAQTFAAALLACSLPAGPEPRGARRAAELLPRLKRARMCEKCARCCGFQRCHQRDLDDKNLAGPWPHSQQLLARLGSLQQRPSIVSFNAAAAACGRGNHWSSSIQCVADAAAGYLQPDLLTLTPLMKCRAGDRWPAAFTVLALARRSLLRLDEVLLSAATGAEWRRGISCLQILGQMPQDLPCLAKEMPWEASLEPLSSRALGASVAACAAGAVWVQSLCLLNTLQLKLHLITCNAAMSCCQKGLLA